MDGAFPSEKGQDFEAEAYGRGVRRGFRGNEQNAKTKICNRWMNGDCRFGDRCNFAHGETELRKLIAPNDGMAGRGPFPNGGRGRGPFPGYPGRGYGGRGGRQGGYGYDQGGYGGRGDMGGRPQDETYLAQGSPIYGPNGWVQYRSKEGEPYFHNHNTQVTQWERPVDWPQGV